MRSTNLFTIALAVLTAPLHAQTKPVPEPITPPARTFHDPRSGINFQVPAGWDLSRKDHEVSSFSQDARSTTRTTQLRAVANITFNPFPQTTFSGALFYVSLTPRLSDADCARQVSAKNPRPVATTQVSGIPFTHGYDEHGGVCVESRDEIYTALHNGSCYRFDLVVNTFCGGDVSGVRDMNERQFEAIRKRLEAILATVQFDK
ncbi:MAG: hypothetical protein JWM43_3822 [Acidobacteriaceae bacterium]|nr:hypothetical protein [Acidobacteriaceae bacterium]